MQIYFQILNQSSTKLHSQERVEFVSTVTKWKSHQQRRLYGGICRALQQARVIFVVGRKGRLQQCHFYRRQMRFSLSKRAVTDHLESQSICHFQHFRNTVSQSAVPRRESHFTGKVLRSSWRYLVISFRFRPKERGEYKYSCRSPRLEQEVSAESETEWSNTSGHLEAGKGLVQITYFFLG